MDNKNDKDLIKKRVALKKILRRRYQEGNPKVSSYKISELENKLKKSKNSEFIWKILAILFFLALFFSALLYSLDRNRMNKENKICKGKLNINNNIIADFQEIVSQLEKERQALKEENEVLMNLIKQSENKTKLIVNETDYHLTPELFCQHYGGIAIRYGLPNSLGFIYDINRRCDFIIRDTIKSCPIELSENNYYFKEKCEAVK